MSIKIYRDTRHETPNQPNNFRRNTNEKAYIVFADVYYNVFLIL